MQIIVRVFSLYRREWIVPCVTGISTKNTVSNKCYYIRNQRRIYVEVNKCAFTHVQWPNEIAILQEFMDNVTQVICGLDSAKVSYIQ